MLTGFARPNEGDEDELPHRGIVQTGVKACMKAEGDARPYTQSRKGSKIPFPSCLKKDALQLSHVV